MREILFRGKRTDNGEWVYGFYFRDIGNFIKELPSSVSTPLHLVHSETIGQYTGLRDKNGKRIFEGDILAFPDTGEDGYEYKEGYDFINVATVCWNNGRWEFEDFGDENSGVKDDMECCRHEDFIEIFPCSEVIGNIHDNPELIGGKEDGT